MWSVFVVSCGSTILTPQRSATNVIAAAASSSSTSSSLNSDYIGLFLRKILKATKFHQSGYLISNTKHDEVVAQYKVEILDQEGDVLFTKTFEAPPRDKLEVGYWDWKKIVPVSKFSASKGTWPQSQDKNGAGAGSTDLSGATTEENVLLLRVSFTLINRRKDMGKSKMPPHVPCSEDELSIREAATAFLNLVSNSKVPQPDLVIEVTNRRKFSVHKKMLVGKRKLRIYTFSLTNEIFNLRNKEKGCYNSSIFLFL